MKNIFYDELKQFLKFCMTAAIIHRVKTQKKELKHPADFPKKYTSQIKTGEVYDDSHKMKRS